MISLLVRHLLMVGRFMVLVPFVETWQESGGGIRFSQPMELAAMVSTNTVTASLTNWFLPEECVVSIKSAGAIHENDQKNVLQQGFTCLGCAKAGLDILESVANSKQLPFISKAFDSLNGEVNSCHLKMIEALSANWSVLARTFGTSGLGD